MAVIDRDGLFYGERLKECSDLAQLWWPRFYHASNGYGRLEIDYDEFCDTAMRSIRTKLTKREFISLIQEYQSNHLLFIYRVGQSLWGQWVGGESNLPKYKSASDRRSPAPPEQELKAFIDEYEQQKADAQIFEVFVNVPKCSAELRNVSETSRSFENVSHGVGIGVGVGTGVGIGEVQEKAERVSQSFGVRGEDQVLKIAYEHPKLQHLAKHNKPLPGGLERLLFERISEDGFDLVYTGTLNLRDAVAKWPPGNERFVPNPMTFYSANREYLKDPKEWDRPSNERASLSDGY